MGFFLLRDFVPGLCTEHRRGRGAGGSALLRYLKMAQMGWPPGSVATKPQNAVSGFRSGTVRLSWDRISESLHFFLRPGHPLLGHSSLLGDQGRHLPEL